MSDQIFGEIEGYPEGTTFESRMELKDAGLHKYHIAGISRVPGIGSDCIVLNKGYADDNDRGELIYYTGEGGRKNNESKHSFNQPFTKGNLDLFKNLRTRYPIRVIRGFKLKNEYAPKSGYRYDGLYYLESCWPDKGEDGYRIWRYKLVLAPTSSLPAENSIQNETATTPRRRERVSNQIVRDPRIPEKLKQIYNFTCQVCGIRLNANGVPYAEGAHIKGLGNPHNGTDTTDNMIILCPNDHHLFDAYGFSINDDLSLIGKEGNLSVDRRHSIQLENIRYHRNKYKLAVQE